MSKVTANKSPASPPETEIPFEEALEKLETIVQAMEAQDLPLESLLNNYAEGCRLSQVCQNKLAEAELKIQALEKNAAGQLALKPIRLSDDGQAPSTL